MLYPHFFAECIFYICPLASEKISGSKGHFSPLKQAITFGVHRLRLPCTDWSCHAHIEVTIYRLSCKMARSTYLLFLSMNSLQKSITRSFYKLLWVVQSSVGCIRPCRPLARVRYMDVESQTALSVYMTKREKEEKIE